MSAAETYDATFIERVSAALRAYAASNLTSPTGQGVRSDGSDASEVQRTPLPIRPQPRMRWTNRPGGTGPTARWAPEY